MMVNFTCHNILIVANPLQVVNPFVSLLSFPSITAADSVMQQSPDADHGLTEDTSTPKPKILTVAASAQDEMGERYVLLQTSTTYTDL